MYVNLEILHYQSITFSYVNYFLNLMPYIQSLEAIIGIINDSESNGIE